MSNVPDDHYEALMAIPEDEFNPNNIFDYLMVINGGLPDNEKIRVWNGKMSVTDLARMVYGCAKNRSAEIIRDLTAQEVTANSHVLLRGLELHKFEGPGQKPVPVASPSEAISIIRLFDRRVPLISKLQRACDRITLRYLAADVTMAEEITERNAQFENNEVPADHPAHLFRNEVVQEPLNSPPAPTAIETGIEEATAAVARLGLDQNELRQQSLMMIQARIRQMDRQSDREDELMRNRITHMNESHKAEMMLRAEEIATLRVTTIKKYTEMMAMKRKTVIETPTFDERDQVFKQSEIRNINRMERDYLAYFNSGLKTFQLAITAGSNQSKSSSSSSSSASTVIEEEPEEEAPKEVEIPEPLEELTFEQFATEDVTKSWISTKSQAIGKEAVKIYRAERKSEPVKRKISLASGKTVEANAYFTGDESIIERAIAIVKARENKSTKK